MVHSNYEWTLEMVKIRKLSKGPLRAFVGQLCTAVGLQTPYAGDIMCFHILSVGVSTLSKAVRVISGRPQ